MYQTRKYEGKDQRLLLHFLEECLPQSGRRFQPEGRHKMYYSVNQYFEHFWCLFDRKYMIGTVALKKLDDKRYELKSLYLLEKYHKKGLGKQLLKLAIQKAWEEGCKEIYLDTLSSSKNAIHLYEKTGFVRTQRYNSNDTADVFMKLSYRNDSKNGIPGSISHVISALEKRKN